MAAIKPDSAWITATMEMFLAAGLALGCGAGCCSMCTLTLKRKSTPRDHESVQAIKYSSAAHARAPIWSWNKSR